VYRSSDRGSRVAEPLGITPEDLRGKPLPKIVNVPELFLAARPRKEQE
jgi:hypothetical protein